MKHPVFVRETLPRYLEALNRLTPQTPARWGEMDVVRMLAHLRQAFQMTLNEVPVEDKSNWLTRRKLVWRLMFEWSPWPPGKIKAPPVFFPHTNEGFERERQLVAEGMQRFVDALEREPSRIGISPMLGPVPFEYWKVIHGRHTAHHLDQFGVWS